MTDIDVSEVLGDLTETLQMKRITKLPVDFEVKEQSLGVDWFEVHLQPMPEQEVVRKPEGDRQWMWWKAWSEQRLELDWMVQDDRYRVFKVAAREDWSKFGMLAYQLVEQPVGLAGEGAE